MKPLIFMAILILLRSVVVAQSENTSYGASAGNSGNRNSAFGSMAADLVTGNDNTAIGWASGIYLTSGNRNAFVGARSGNGGFTGISGSNNSFLGYQTGLFLTSGSDNTFLGNNAGYYASTGSGNIFIGSNAGFYETGSNKLYISNPTSTLISGDFSTNQLQLGGSVGIGIWPPQESLHLNGSIRGNINGALRINSGNGYVDIGAMNSGWAHLQTDRPRFYFQRGITVDEGLIGSYDENLQLQTSGTTRLTISNSNGYVGVGTTNPTNQFQIGTNPSGYTASDFVVSNSTGSFAIQNQPADTYLYGSRDISIRPAGAMAFYANTSGNVGIGTSAPASKLHVYNSGSTYMSLDKPSSTYEAGIQFSKAGSVQFYLYNDDSNDALKIQTTGLSGEADATPRMQFPKTNKDIYMAESGGMVGIGHNAPTEKIDVNGTARLRGLTQDNSLVRILASDVNGKVFWRDAFIPSTNNTIDLGSPSNSFKDIYLDGKLFINDYQFTKVTTYSSCVGRLAGFNSSGTYNSIFGNEAGYNCSGNYNTLLGHSAGFNTSSSGNTFVGNQSGFANTTGGGNTLVGESSLKDNVSGSDNSCFGYGAGLQRTSGSRNCFFGTYAGISTGVGGSNSYFGYKAGENNGGLNNTFIGADAGSSTANNAVAIGYNAKCNANNSVAIGANSQVNVGFGIVLGTSASLVGISQNSPAYALHVYNAYCDGSTWYNASDKNLKKNFRAITSDAILDKLMSLKIERWTYKADSTNADHIGPVAQDFNEAFKLGNNDKSISTVDEIGIALAAIQELNRKTQKLEDLIKTQQQAISTLLTFNTQEDVQKDSNVDGLELYQNTPNPFKSGTEIRMRIPATVVEATLFIYDLQGRQINKHLIIERGNTNYRIEGGSLSAGMYIYALTGDGKTAGVKRMILTE